MDTSSHGLGVDVAADHVHCVELDPDGRVVRSALVERGHLDTLRGWAAPVGVVAIDAPSEHSTEPHRDERSLSRKFRTARCCEIALGRERGIWVPWVTPAGPPYRSWMETGFALYRTLTGAAQLLETYPQAVFRTLASGTVPRKSMSAGLVARVALLHAAGVRDLGLPMWGHDGLDAAAAALVALHRAEGRAEPATCGHDDSAIWLPRVTRH